MRTLDEVMEDLLHRLDTEELVDLLEISADELLARFLMEKYEVKYEKIMEVLEYDEE